MDSLLGHRLGGKYEIQSEIGRGGMGIVYLAHDTMLRRTVAVKVLSPQLAADPTFVQRFRREAVAAANLRHPNIVTIYDVGEDALSGQAIHYIVMENIEGETLDRLAAATTPALDTAPNRRNYPSGRRRVTLCA